MSLQQNSIFPQKMLLENIHSQKDIETQDSSETSETLKSKNINNDYYKIDSKMEEEKDIRDIMQIKPKASYIYKNIANYKPKTNYELKKIYEQLKKESVEELKKPECNEYYFISRKFFVKLRKFLNSYSNKDIYEELGKIKNDEFLIDKKLLDNALYLKDEKESINILKPKYSFCEQYKPLPIFKPFWDFLFENFKGGPEVKESYDYFNGIKQKRDYAKYVKINCIILPKKKVNVDLCGDSRILKSKKDIISAIQSFYFYLHKHKTIKDLLDHLEQIVRCHDQIGLVNKEEYKCWIDLNFKDFKVLLQQFEEKILEVYNINNINPEEALNLDQIEEKDDSIIITKSNFNNPNCQKFGFKLCPAQIFNNEIIMNIFPNQFTNNFNEINQNKLKELNEKLKTPDFRNFNVDSSFILNKFPELTIIIEQGHNTLFIKNPDIKYQIGMKCNYSECDKRGILTRVCECKNKFYCSYSCQKNDIEKHSEECPVLLSQYLIETTKGYKPILDENSLLGIKGINNLESNCYMNTAIQCLSNCSELRNYFLFAEPEKQINMNNIKGKKGLSVLSFKQVIEDLWYDNEIILDINKFKQIMGVCDKKYKNKKHQDVHEFLMFLLNSLHDDLNKVKDNIKIKKNFWQLDDDLKSKIEWNNFLKKNQSIIIDLFYGLFKSTIICKECNKSNIDFNIFSSLPLSIRNKNSFNNIDTLNNSNKDNNKEILIIYLPYSNNEKITLFTLNITEEKTQFYQKLNDKISQILNKDMNSLYWYDLSNNNEIFNVNLFGNNNCFSFDYINRNILIIGEISYKISQNYLSANNKNHKILSPSSYESNNFDNITNNSSSISSENNDSLNIRELKYKINDMNEAFQIILKNMILNGNNNRPMSYGFPKILFFPKNYTINDIYYELFQINKNIILDSYSNNANIDEKLFIVKFNINEQENFPFTIYYQIYKNKTKEESKETLIVFDINSQKTKIGDILKKYLELKNNEDIQIIFKIYWKQKYYQKIKDIYSINNH